MLQTTGPFSYSYVWLIILACFLVFGIILPCCVRAYRRHKYGLSVFGSNINATNNTNNNDYYESGAQVSRQALAELNALEAQHIHIQNDNVQDNNNNRQTTTNTQQQQQQQYSFPTANGYKLSSYTEHTQVDNMPYNYDNNTQNNTNTQQNQQQYTANQHNNYTSPPPTYYQ